MFDFAWSEIALIGVVALIAIGPKDMPVAIKAMTDMIKKARRMAGEFQTHVDEMVREANLHEVRDQIKEIRNFDLRGTLERAVDDDGSLRRAFDDPLKSSSYAAPSWSTEPTSPQPAIAGSDGMAAQDGETGTIAAPATLPTSEADAFGPATAEAPAPDPAADPAAGADPTLAGAHAEAATAATVVVRFPEVPAFIPPGAAAPQPAPAFIPPEAVRAARDAAARI